MNKKYLKPQKGKPLRGFRYDWLAAGGGSGSSDTTLDISEDSVALTVGQSRIPTGEIGNGSTRMFWYPAMLHHDGKTYRVMHHDASTGFPYGWVRMLIFDNQRGFVRPVLMGNILTGYDGHYIPIIEVAPDPSTGFDTIYVVQEDLHDSPLNVWKSRGDNEWSKFTQLTDIGTELSYPHILRKDNGNRFIWSRGMSPEFDIYVTEASNKFETWGAQLRVSESPLPDALERRHYPAVPFGYQKANGKWNLLITARRDTNEAYYRHYWVETDDTLRTFTNVQGTWSRHIVNDGILTDVILAANAKYFESAAETTNGGFPCAGMSADGLRCVLVRGSDGTLANSSFMYYSGGWQSKPFGVHVPNLFDGPLHGVGEYLMVFSETDIRVVVWIDDGTYKKPHLYQTTDLGDTWNDILDFGAGINASLGLSLPVNIMDISPNENFEIQLSEWSINDAAIIHRKVSAWNTIQAIPAVNVTAATSMNWNSTGLFHYRMRNGEITKSGHSISAATDQFGIRNATTSGGSPQWDGGNFASFVAASSMSMVVGTPASLVNQNPCTFICVGKFTEGCVILNFSQSSVNNKALSFKVEGDGVVSYQIFNATAFQVRGQDNVMDGNPHVIVITLDGRANPHIWVDGKKQYFETALPGASALWTSSMGKGPSAISGLNVVNIARIDFTTDIYSTFSLGEMAFFSDVLPTEEILARCKMLCTDYGITFQTEYAVP